MSFFFAQTLTGFTWKQNQDVFQPLNRDITLARVYQKLSYFQSLARERCCYRNVQSQIWVSIPRSDTNSIAQPPIKAKHPCMGVQGISDVTVNRSVSSAFLSRSGKRPLDVSTIAALSCWQARSCRSIACSRSILRIRIQSGQSAELHRSQQAAPQQQVSLVYTWQYIQGRFKRIVPPVRMLPAQLPGAWPGSCSDVPSCKRSR